MTRLPLRTAVLLLLCAGAGFAQATDGLEFKLPAKAGEPFKGKVPAPAGTEWVVIFYRLEGEEDFNSFNLDAQPDGTFTGDQDITTKPGVKLEYYAAQRTPGGITYLPKDAPGKFAILQLPGGEATAAPKPTGAEAQPPVPPTSGAPWAPTAPGTPGAGPGFPGGPGGPTGPGGPPKPGVAPSLPGQPGVAPPQPSLPPNGPVSGDFALEQLVHHQQEVPDEKKTQAAGQLRLYHKADWADGGLLLNARLTYTNQPFTDQPRWGVGDLQAVFTSGHHKVQVGDMMVQESEFTLGGAGRRGFDYAYASVPANAHVFALNTQTPKSTQSLFWPNADSGVYGGSLGYGWFNDAFKAKVIFLTGKDDPATATNVGYAFPMPVREGSTGALLLDGRLLENRLNLSGEYARSLYTPDTSLAQPKDSDQAWRLSGLWNQGAFSAHLGYHEVGRAFGTVGVAYFVGDRRLLDGTVAWNQPTWSLSAVLSDERTNPTGQVGLSQAWNQTLGLDARFVLNPRLAWRLGLRQARQEAEVVADPLIPFSNSTRSGVVTGLDLQLPPLTSLSFNLQYDRLASSDGTGVAGSCTTLSLGGSVGIGQWCRLSPNLSWSRTLSDPGEQVTTVANAFFNAELNLVPNRLLFVFTGGTSHSALPTGDTLTTTNVEGTLRLLLDGWLRGKARAGLGLKAGFTHFPVLAGGPANDNRVSLLLNVSF
jgi:hypothetical protein